MYRRAAALSVLALLAAACNGGEEAVSPTQPPITSDTMFVTTTTTEPAAPATVPSVSTTASTSAPTTGPPDTTSAPTTPPATEATTSPQNDVDQVRDEIVEASVAAWQAYDAVLRNPGDPGVLEVMANRMTEEQARLVVEEFTTFYITNGLAERPNPDVPASLTPRPETVEFGDGPTEAFVETCFVSSNLLVQVGAAADGSDTVEDDTVAAITARERFVFDDGRWLYAGAEVINTQIGETECAA